MKFYFHELLMILCLMKAGVQINRIWSRLGWKKMWKSTVTFSLGKIISICYFSEKMKAGFKLTEFEVDYVEKNCGNALWPFH